jgi:hypothetical protein
MGGAPTFRTTMPATIAFALLIGTSSAQSVTDSAKRDACMQKAKEAGLLGKGANQILASQCKDFMKTCMKDK